MSHERTITVGIGNKFYNLPTVIGGKRVSTPEAIAAFKRSRRHLGVFDNEAAALAAAEARSTANDLPIDATGIAKRGAKRFMH